MAGRDASEVLELVEEASDEVALAVQVIGHRAPLPAVPLGRDVGARAMVGNEFEDDTAGRGRRRRLGFWCSACLASVRWRDPDPLFPPAACWWDAHHRGVEEMKRPRRARRQRLEQALPHPLPGPAVAAVSDCRMRPAAFRKVAPRRAGAQDVKGDQSAVIAPRLVRRQRRDDRPFRIRQIVPSLHPQAPTVWKLESHQSRKENPFSFMSTRPRRFSRTGNHARGRVACPQTSDQA